TIVEETQISESKEENQDNDINETDNSKTDSLKVDDIATASELDDILIATISEVVDTDDEVLIATISEVADTDDEVLIATISELSGNKIATDSELVDEDNLEEPFFGYVDSGLPPIKPKKKKNRFKLFSANKIPTKYDSRDVINEAGYSIVPPIRNQNPYGTCWSFSTVGMVETSIRKKNLVEGNTEEEYETNSDLSEAAFAYFTIEGLKDVTNSNNIDKPGVEGRDYNGIDADYLRSKGSTTIPRFINSGGDLIDSTLLGTTYMGLTKEQYVPHKQNVIKSILENGLDGRAAFNSNVFEMANVDMMPKEDRDAIKKAIMKNGSAGIVYHEAQTGYTIKNIGDEWYYMSPRRFDNNGNIVAKSANHAVLVVGWDDEIPVEYFSYHNDVIDKDEKPAGPGGWLIRNSWGEYSQSNGGYFWMSYYDLSIGNTLYSIDAVKADTYKYNYHYDTTSSTEFYDTVDDLNTYEVGNVFKVSNDFNQKLDAINFAHYSEIGNATIKIYTSDNPMKTPTDGTLRHTQNISYEGQGIFTIPLNKSIPLKKDTYFSIVLKFSDSVYLFVDDSVDYGKTPENRFKVFLNEVAKGQSFFIDSDSNTWVDLNKENTFRRDGITYGRNFRIRALTNEAKILSFDSNGGQGFMESVVFESGDTITIPKNVFDKKGCTFSHWVDEDLNEYVDESEIELTDDKVLKAVWDETIYNLSYGWFESSVTHKNKNEITKIDILVYPQTAPTSFDYEWDIEGSNGLKGYIKGTEVTIYAPTKGNIYVKEDGSYLFSEKQYDGDIFIGPDLTNSFVNVLELNGLNNLDTSRVKNMERMFAGFGLFNMCDSLEEWPFALKTNPKSINLDISSFNTSNVVNMSLVFEASAIESIDISHFDTKKVETMDFMFAQCELLKSVNLNSIDTESLTSAEGMFEEAISLTSINLDNVTLKNVTNLNYMFTNLRSIASIDLSSFDTSNVTKMQEMFANCENLKTIYVSSKFKTDKVTDSDNMFDNCQSLIGGNGTTYDSTNANDKTLAKVDGGAGNRGYFTNTGFILVTFDLDGKGPSFTQQVENHQKLVKPENPNIAGYIFNHWYDIEEGEPIEFDFDTEFHISDGVNRTLRASFEKKRAKRIEGITKPTRINYNVGDEIDLTGLKTKIVFEDDTIKELEYSDENSKNFIIKTNFVTESKIVDEREFVTVQYRGDFQMDDNVVRFENNTLEAYKINIVDLDDGTHNLPDEAVLIQNVEFMNNPAEWTDTGKCKDYFINNP
ncbi:MAG: BspA family leucine-rich repeat surface protein, partial [Lachnospiraceae bacterium]|nr:BspA family leucine-rich repeat surface protein [Lachnospiraceae bacterium]